jgi:hypothetical protein
VGPRAVLDEVVKRKIPSPRRKRGKYSWHTVSQKRDPGTHFIGGSMGLRESLDAVAKS